MEATVVDAAPAYSSSVLPNSVIQTGTSATAPGQSASGSTNNLEQREYAIPLATSLFGVLLSILGVVLPWFYGYTLLNIYDEGLVRSPPQASRAFAFLVVLSALAASFFILGVATGKSAQNHRMNRGFGVEKDLRVGCAFKFVGSFCAVVAFATFNDWLYEWPEDCAGLNITVFNFIYFGAAGLVDLNLINKRRVRSSLPDL